MSWAHQLCIVIPIYNEEQILQAETERIMTEMAAVLPDVDYEILFVQNGSTDATPAIIADLAARYPNHLCVINRPAPGYGEAVKEGVLKSNGRYTAIFNIDFWDVSFIKAALAEMAGKGAALVIGSKSMQGAADSRSWFRRLITRGFNVVLKNLFGFRGTDTHGIKLLVTEKILPVVSRCETGQVIFDTELVLRSQHEGLTITEIPVVCVEKRATRLKLLRNVWITLRDLGIIFWSLHRRWLIRAGAVAGLVALSIFFVVAVGYGFPDSPSPWFDEGINLGIAKTWVQSGQFTLALGNNQLVMERGLMISTSYPVLAPLALVFTIFGVGLVQAKAVMAAFLVLFLSCAWYFISRHYGRRAAWLGVALAVTFLPFYGNGLSGGLGEVPGLCFLFGSLIFLDAKKSWQIWLAGLLVGLCGATKVFYLVTLGALGVSELIFAIGQRQIPWKRWVLLGAGIVPPLVVWAYTLLPPGTPLNQLASVLAYYKNPYAVQGTLIPNLLKFITESTPLHFSILAATLAVAVVRRRRARAATRQEVLILAFILLNVIWFLKTPGWYRYLFPAQLAVVVLFPAMVVRVGEFLPRSRWWQTLPGLAVVTLLLAQSVHFVLNRGTTLYFNPAPRQFAAELARQVPSGATLFFIDQPELWFLYPGIAGQYLQMNPYVAFGQDIFKTKQFPQYIVNDNPEENAYLAEHRQEFARKYQLVERFQKYQLFKLNRSIK